MFRQVKIAALLLFWNAFSSLLEIVNLIILMFMKFFWLDQLMPDLYFVLSVKRSPSQSISDIKRKVLENPQVIEIIGYEINSKGQRVLNRMRYTQTKEILNLMAGNINVSFLKVLFYILTKVWPFLFNFGIHVNEEDIRILLEYARKGYPMIYLPTHKSHLDYLLMAYVYFLYGIPLPQVVSGDNLNFPVIGKVLHNGGAFFIRRSFARDSDPLYTTIFNAYIKELLSHGISLECFIEGGRSRSGKLLPPKTGFLRNVVDSAFDNHFEVYMVPISISYDRIIENESHLKELVGGVKKKEQLIPFLKSCFWLFTSTLFKKSHFGRVDIRIAKPFSLQEYVKESYPNTDITIKMRKKIAFSVGYRTLHECNRISVISPAALVATILLTHPHRGIHFKVLIQEVYWLSKQIKSRGGNVISLDSRFLRQELSLVLGTIVGKNQLVKRHKNVFMIRMWSPEERMELSVFRNQLLHPFVHEGLLACVFYMKEVQSGKWPIAVNKEELIEHVKFLSDLLKFEFIYGSYNSNNCNLAMPGEQMLKENFEQTIQDMLDRGILKSLGDDSLIVDDTSIDGKKEGTITYLFLCALFWHFIDSYWIVSLGFFFLLQNAMEEEEFLQRIQRMGETLYFDGQLDLYEAIAKETLKNAIRLFDDWKIIEIGQNSKKGRLLSLKQEYANENEIENLARKIARFRKRSSAYRSRRYRLKRGDSETTDAIGLAKALS